MIRTCLVSKRINQIFLFSIVCKPNLAVPIYRSYSSRSTGTGTRTSNVRRKTSIGPSRLHKEKDGGSYISRSRVNVDTTRLKSDQYKPSLSKPYLPPDKTYDGKNKITTVTYENGDIYEGRLMNNERHGAGKMLFSNGNVYEGQWLRGLRHGLGTQQYYNGGSYSGEWSSGRQAGRGKYTSAEGSSWEGQWRRGEPSQVSSIGVTITTATGVVYKGNFVNLYRYGLLSQQPAGKGSIMYQDNTRYEGEIKYGVRHGCGTLYDSEGKISAHGQWQRGQFFHIESKDEQPVSTAGRVTFRKSLYSKVQSLANRNISRKSDEIIR